MLINKWLVIDSFNSRVYRDWHGGFCLDLYYEPGEMSDLYKELQRLPVENRFTIVLPGKNSLTQKPGNSYIEKIISLFFQPSYFLAKGKPVVFLNDNATDHLFIEKLGEKCLKQGLSILMLKTKNAADIASSGGQFAYEVTSTGIDYEAIIENWLSQLLGDKDPGEIHLLLEKNAPGLPGILSTMREKEMALYKTERYKFANLAYQKQTLIDKYKKELDLRIAAEKDTQLYLTMQKKQTADNVEWYHHEYEILPTWYKRFGHFIKVVTGKRSFRSLFSDKVKKYKD